MNSLGPAGSPAPGDGRQVQGNVGEAPPVTPFDDFATVTAVKHYLALPGGALGDGGVVIGSIVETHAAREQRAAFDYKELNKKYIEVCIKEAAASKELSGLKSNTRLSKVMVAFGSSLGTFAVGMMKDDQGAGLTVLILSALLLGLGLFPKILARGGFSD